MLAMTLCPIPTEKVNAGLVGNRHGAPPSLLGGSSDALRSSKPRHFRAEVRGSVRLNEKKACDRNNDNNERQSC